MHRPLRIALLVSYSLAYCCGILRGVKAYARTKQDWVFTPVAPESNPLAAVRDLKPAGVIAHLYSADLARSLGRLGRPIVNVSGVLSDSPFPRVGLDDEPIGRLAAEHLVGRGLRHFAFVGHADHGYSVRREAAFRRWVGRAGHPVDSYHEENAEFNPRGRLWALDRRVRTWLTGLPRPVGMFACNDVWGVQLAEACRQAGRRGQEDVAVLGGAGDALLGALARPW